MAKLISVNRCVISSSTVRRPTSMRRRAVCSWQPSAANPCAATLSFLDWVSPPLLSATGSALAMSSRR